MSECYAHQSPQYTHVAGGSCRGMTLEKMIVVSASTAALRAAIIVVIAGLSSGRGLASHCWYQRR